MSKIISIHEYVLKPDVNEKQFEQAIRQSKETGLFNLPGLIAHQFVRGIRGARRDHYAIIWVYEDMDAWERLWGSVEEPIDIHGYPDNWKVWEDEVLALFLDRAPDTITYTAYEEI